ncbi:MAG: sporulation protein YabP [Clostridiales bacterium]|nr:sporulation protein YabP [Clostridiales bacterium]
MITKKPIGVHKIQVISRNQTNITGVNDILSFDAGEILLETEQGILMIRGQELHVNRLTLEEGEVDVEGRIDSLTYSDTSGYGKTAESFVSRLFK